MTAAKAFQHTMTIYDPQEDSYMMQEAISKHAFGKVLDMGTGSGILGISASGNDDVSEIVFSDIDEGCIEHARKAFKTRKKKAFAVSDLFSSIRNKFDTIIFNPPYLPKDQYDVLKSTTGGKKGNEILKRFLSRVKDHLTKNGKVLIVVSSLTPDVEKLIKKNNFKFKKLSENNLPFFEKLTVYLLEI